MTIDTDVGIMMTMITVVTIKITTIKVTMAMGSLAMKITSKAIMLSSSHWRSTSVTSGQRGIKLASIRNKSTSVAFLTRSVIKSASHMDCPTYKVSMLERFRKI